MLGEMLEGVRKNSPLVHSITNYVTAHDCANILIAAGASPIMADDCEDAVDITSVCSALNINIGTLNSRTVPAMLAAGKRANELSHPVLLDPVGVGASRLRTETAIRLLNEVNFSAIRGNISEIKTLAVGNGSTRGVDVSELDRLSSDSIDATVKMAMEFSGKTGAVVMITGELDIIADSSRAYLCRNGCAMMGNITGSGCMLSAMTAAYIAANPGDMLTAAVASVAAMGLAGELAFARMTEQDGNASYSNYLIDAIYRMTGDSLERGAKIELKV